jgi:type IV secretory pathway VirB3-like protein
MNARPVYRSLNKVMTIWGVERKLFFFNLIVSFSLFTLFEAVVVAAVIFVSTTLMARAATATDPQFLRIVLNSGRFSARYDPAKRQRKGRS